MMNSLRIQGPSRPARHVIVALCASTVLAACNAGERLANIGAPPEFSPIDNPANSPNYQRVRLPQPTPKPVVTNKNSLWLAGSDAFFQDQRARDIGDILTVLIEINDQAQLENETDRARTSTEAANLPAFLGLESLLSDVLPDAVDPSDLIEFDSDTSSEGEAEITRSELIELRLAAVVTDSLPNGNLIIYGRQEVRVNFEVRDLEVAGVIRPEDVTSANTINLDQIAEARIAYGGRGQLTDVQQPRYGQQLYDIVFPF